MANTAISPNMNMPVPVVGVDPGPDWATNVNSCLSIIDSHNHTSGQGVSITPQAIDINDDLPMNGNNLTTARSVRFTPQTGTITNPTDLGCLYENGVDLYYVDGAGNQVRITQGGSVTGATGTITGLPSGTASAAFAGGTFTFQSATNTPATMNIGPIVTGAAVASSKTVTISASGSQPANYALTWPLAQGAAGTTIINDGSGNLSFVAVGATLSAQGLSIVNPSNAAVTSLTLTTGTWSVTGAIGLVTPNGAATLELCINPVSASFAGTSIGIDRFQTGVDAGGKASIYLPVTLISSPGTYYLNVATNTATTVTGYMTAIRIA